MPNRAEHRGRSGARKRQAPRAHLVEHRAEAEQVRARVEVFPTRLFRRHVGHRAQRRARAGEVASFARPKSRIFAWPRVVIKIFAGFMSRCVMPLLWAASIPSAI